MTKIGYKATYNYKCLTQTYEIGLTYQLDNKPIICEYGFHYCVNAKQTLNHYDYNHKFKLLEIEDISNDTIVQDDKSCSNHIKIVREITDPNELLQLLGVFKTFNQNGQELTYKDDTGFLREYTYNENGQKLTYKNSDGYWYNYSYNENFKTIKFNNSDGFCREITYDSSGNEFSRKDNNMFVDNILI